MVTANAVFKRQNKIGITSGVYIVQMSPVLDEIARAWQLDFLSATHGYGDQDSLGPAILRVHESGKNVRVGRLPGEYQVRLQQ